MERGFGQELVGRACVHPPTTERHASCIALWSLWKGSYVHDGSSQLLGDAWRCTYADTGTHRMWRGRIRGGGAVVEVTRPQQFTIKLMEIHY
jgi:hypothetical protein